MPSGIETDTGYTATHSVNADVTVTFSAPKIGILNYPGAAAAGEVVVADIGIPWEFLGAPGDLEIWGQAEYADLLPTATPGRSQERARPSADRRGFRRVSRGLRRSLPMVPSGWARAT